MKRIFLHLFTLISLSSFAQDNITERAKPIVDEGRRLYKSEMASWYGTDLFLANYKNQANIMGYFSYPGDGVEKCVFFSKGDNPKVIGTISFDSTYDTKTANIDLTERDFTANEIDLYTIRKLALAAIQTDTLFRTYKNTNLNLIPVIYNGEKKVFVLTGPQQSGVVIFGNDYLLTFSQDNQLTNKKQLHRNIITINYGGKEEEGKEIEGAIHSHRPETGDYITATDICTLMLYEKFAKWKNHTVVSEHYINIWDCTADQLVVITREAAEKINGDGKKRRRKDD